jgi:hypothetical protein
VSLRTEADLVRTLSGTMRLEEIYHAAETAGLADRAAGHEVIHGRTDTRCRRRVRNALQGAQRSGRARRVDRATWVLTSGVPRPSLVLLLAVGDLGEVELAVSDAAALFTDIEEQGIPIDLALCDPPWGLGRSQTGEEARDGSERIYGRTSSSVVGGYIDTDRAGYPEFTHRWVRALAGAMRSFPGSQAAIVSGPEMAARIQVATEDAGLTFVTKHVAKKAFPLYAHRARRPSFGHLEVLVVCSGRLDDPRRFFWSPGLDQRARSGRTYPTTWLDNVGSGARPGELRYDNALPPNLVRRMISAYSRGPENGGRVDESLVVDGFSGGGTVAIEALRSRRRVIAADLNPRAVDLTAARILEEVVWPVETCPTLFDQVARHLSSG